MQIFSFLFDRHLEKLRRGPEAERVHYISVCSPNYLHDAHCRLAMRVGADVICEKPLEITLERIDAMIRDKTALAQDLLQGSGELPLTELDDKALLDLVSLDL